MAATVEARLQYLETREEANTKEILKLKSENVVLKNTIHDMTTVISITERNLKELDNRCRKFENDMQEVFSFRASFDDRLNQLELAIKSVRDSDDRVNMMETGINEARQDMNDFTQSMTERLELLDAKGNIPNSVIDGMNDRVQYLENKTVIQTESVVDVKLRSHQRMNTNIPIKMDQCEQVFQDGGWFDADSCMLQPHEHGDFLICVVFIQAGQGQINVSARIDGKDTPLHFGHVNNADDPLSSCTRVVTLRKGEKLWLEAVRTEGKGFVYWCRLYCRML